MTDSRYDPDELADVVRAVWQQELDESDFADDDPFFAIGGHSLAAIRVMGALSERYGVRLPVRLLFRNRTVETLVPALATYLSELAGPAEPTEPSTTVR